MAYPAVSLILFACLDKRMAVALTYLLGLIFLPVGNYPFVDRMSEIIGTALPAQMLVTKTWVAPLVAAFGLLVFDRGRVWAFRPQWPDAVMLLWILWPLVSGIGADARPAGGVSTLYLAGSWGLPWLLGRICFGDSQGRVVLLKAVVFSAVLLLPLAVVEGLHRPWVYPAIYGTHPFLTDGIERYIGYRPLAFFEDGNQYGIWVALAALAGVGLVVARERPSPIIFVATAVLIVMTLAAQSVGGILLLAIGSGLFWIFRAGLVSRKSIVVAMGAVVLFGGIYISGVIPFRYLVTHTTAGRTALDLIRQTGRGSFAWRIAQDERALPLVVQHPLTGHAKWDWWATLFTRPWGLAMLILGQFGLIGLLLAATALTATSLKTLWRATTTRFSPVAMMTASIVLMAGADALLNAFVFLPAICLAGALTMRRSPATAETA